LVQVGSLEFRPMEKVPFIFCNERMADVDAIGKKRPRDDRFVIIRAPMLLSWTTSREARDRRGAPPSLGHRTDRMVLALRPRTVSREPTRPSVSSMELIVISHGPINACSCVLEVRRRRCYRLKAAGNPRGEETIPHESTGSSQGIAENGAQIRARLNVCTLRISAM
jgi:hypothetical protein